MPPLRAAASSGLGSPTRAPRESAASPSLPLFLSLASGELLRPSEVERDAGDEACRIVRLAHPDGRAHLAADCRSWLECDCPGWTVDRGCDHLRALVRAGVFKALSPEPKGGPR